MDHKARRDRVMTVERRRSSCYWRQTTPVADGPRPPTARCPTTQRSKSGFRPNPPAHARATPEGSQERSRRAHLFWVYFLALLNWTVSSFPEPKNKRSWQTKAQGTTMRRRSV